MPCRGPDWDLPSEEEYAKIRLKEHIEYVKNTAQLLLECNKLLGRLSNEDVRHGLNISELDVFLSDHLTNELCSIFNEIKSNPEVQEKIQSSQYVHQLITWKSEHDRLDQQRNKS